jgi:hypothetical protein
MQLHINRWLIDASVALSMLMVASASPTEVTTTDMLGQLMAQGDGGAGRQRSGATIETKYDYDTASSNARQFRIHSLLGSPIPSPSTRSRPADLAR